MKKLLFFAATLFVILSVPPTAPAAQKITIVYQNDLHGWLFPSSTGVGMGKMSRILTPLFEKTPRSFYALSGDLFTGPNLPKKMKGVAELEIWNHFWMEMERRGFGNRVLISAGNHEFDYGVPAPGSFRSGLLCANLVTRENQAYYTPCTVVECPSGLRVGFVGLLLTGNRRVITTAETQGLKMIPMLEALKKTVPAMGPLDLTVLMIHDHLWNIRSLARAMPPDLGVDMILSGHDHLVIERPLKENGIYIFQAGAMNEFYGRVDLLVDGGKIVEMKNRIHSLIPTPLGHATLLVKEMVDSRAGKTVALLKRPLTGAFLRGRENSLGDFVTDAFRWATGTDVAMTNSSSLRMDLRIYQDECRELNEGDFKSVCYYRDRLVTGKVSGAQIMRVIEGDAVRFVNQVSGMTYRVDPSRPSGKRVVDATIGGKPISPHRIYTLTHNAYCTRPENMMKYLHLPSGSVVWEETDIRDYQAAINYARHLKVIDYPTGGKGRIVVLP